MTHESLTVRVAGEEVNLTPEQGEGLPRISLAVNANSTARYLIGLNKVDTTILQRLHSIKLPPNALIPDKVNPDIQHLVTAEAMVAHQSGKRELPAIWIDTKFSFDGSELAASVDSLKTSSRIQKDNSLQRLRSGKIHRHQYDRVCSLLPPRYISFVISNQSDPDELKIARSHAGANFEVVGMVSSSKQKPGINEQYGFNHKGLTASMARMAMDAGMYNLAAAASDAAHIRDSLSGHPDVGRLRIFGTGATLHSTDIGEHDTNVSVEEVRESVDVFVLGQAVLFHSSPDTHLLEYAQSIGK